MWVARATFQLPDTTPETVDTACELLEDWTSSARQNGQLLGNVYPVYREGNSLHYTLLVPEADSLDERYNNIWVRKAFTNAAEEGITGPSFTLLGTDAETVPSCHCLKRSSLILYTNYRMIGSPLQCGDCFESIPLYQIPPTYDDSEYYNLKSWETDYQACDTLQMGCETGERFALREMSSPISSLTKRGRELCEQITQSTNTPTYYYLFRYHGRSLAKERERRCPACNGEWLLPEPLFDRFDFRCDNCRLLSTIALNQRRTSS